MLKTEYKITKKNVLNSNYVLNIIYVIFFMIIIALPCITNLLGLNGKITGNVANTKKPIISRQNISSFSKEYEKYFNSNFPFKDTLIKYNSLFKYSIFGSSTNSKVLVGKDGWMFPGSSENGDPISDYKGTNLFTDKELIQIKNNLEERESWLKSKGSDFVLVLFPNSNTINSDFMPISVGKYSGMCL